MYLNTFDIAIIHIKSPKWKTQKGINKILTIMQNIEDVSLGDRVRKMLIHLTPRQEGRKITIPNKFAVQVGIAPTTLNNWLNKKRLPSSEGLHKLYLAHPNINYDWIVTGRGSMHYHAAKADNNSNLNNTEISSNTEDSLLVQLLRDELAVKNNHIKSVDSMLDKNISTMDKMTSTMDKMTSTMDKMTQKMERLEKEKKQAEEKLTKAAKALSDKLNDMQAD